MRRIVVIGGGPAGTLAAISAKKHDPSAEVRFWSAYSLGQLCRFKDFGNTEEVLRDLHEVAASDHAEVPKWGLVSKEAAEAIDEISKRAEDEES